MISKLLPVVEITLLLSVAALYIVHCPFNKVEESFNTQAVHDIVNLFPNNLPNNSSAKEGNEVEQQVAIRSHLPWDHILFPGVVPRTFVGALIVGLPLKIAKHFIFNEFVSSSSPGGLEDEEEPDFTAQLILQIGSRFALASFLVLSLSLVTRALQKRFGLTFRLCFLIATVSQFHYMFYAGRFLPNTYATILANVVFSSWINRQYSKSILYVALCVVIFRFDTAIFFGWLLIDAIFIRKYLSLIKVLRIGIPAGLIALTISFLIDSLFWTRPVIPELESLYFNLWLNKSHEWGTKPYFWYVYDCLPRMLLAGLPFIFLADHKITRDYLIPTLAFILTYSFLPHKELRFILFITPFLNISVASGLMNVYYYLNKVLVKLRKGTNNEKSYFATFLFSLILLALFTTNIFACFALSRVSSHNYPGGQAAISLGMTKELLDKAQHSLETSGRTKSYGSDVAVYIDNLAAQTGVSRFLQVNGAYYSKAPHLDEQTFLKSYSLIYLVLEPKEVIDVLVEKHCSIDKNLEYLFANKGVNKWKESNREIKCNLPNQPQMYCSILDTIHSIDLDRTWRASGNDRVGLLGKLKHIITFVRQLSEDTVAKANFVKTRVALHIIRCSTKSKFNPFA